MKSDEANLGRGEFPKERDIVGMTEQKGYSGMEMILSHNTLGQLNGYIRPEYMPVISTGTLVVTETKDKDNGTGEVYYVCRIINLKGGEKIWVDVGKKARRYYVVKAIMDPIRNMVEYPDGRIELNYPKFHRANWQKIRFPKPHQLRAILGIPKEGATLGFAMAPGGNIDFQNVKYRHPLDDRSHGYTGIFVVGKQGQGKTTLGRVEAKSFSETGRNPPAVIILDGEGEYSSLGQENPELTEGDKEVLRDLGLDSPCKDVRYYKLSSDRVDGTYTLSASMLRGRDIPAFLRELTDKSKQELEIASARAYEDWWRTHGQSYDGLTLEEVTQKIHAKIYSARIHHSQRNAIESALRRAPMHLFDVEGKKPLDPKELLQPGRISVISDVGFYEEEQSYVGLYALLTLGRLKIDERNRWDRINVVLLVDEATRRLPSKYDDRYLRQRVAKEIDGMLSVGRKRSFMPVVMTQYPNDVPREMRDKCGVQVVFQVNISGNASWLKQTLRPYMKMIDTLPVGEALVASPVHNEPVHLRVPRSPMRERPPVESQVAGTVEETFEGVKDDRATVPQQP